MPLLLFIVDVLLLQIRRMLRMDVLNAQVARLLLHVRLRQLHRRFLLPRPVLIPRLDARVLLPSRGSSLSLRLHGCQPLSGVCSHSTLGVARMPPWRQIHVLLLGGLWALEQPLCGNLVPMVQSFRPAWLRRERPWRLAGLQLLLQKQGVDLAAAAVVPGEAAFHGHTLFSLHSLQQGPGTIDPSSDGGIAKVTCVHRSQISSASSRTGTSASTRFAHTCKVLLGMMLGAIVCG